MKDNWTVTNKGGNIVLWCEQRTCPSCQQVSRVFRIQGKWEQKQKQKKVLNKYMYHEVGSS